MNAKTEITLTGESAAAILGYATSRVSSAKQRLNELMWVELDIKMSIERAREELTIANDSYAYAVTVIGL